MTAIQGAAASNTGIGATALLALTTGSSNTAVGYQSLYGNATGNDGTAIGQNCLFAETAGPNTAAGYTAAEYITSGTNNTAIGNAAMVGVIATPITGNYNTGLGASALTALQGAATTNTAVGYEAGQDITTGGSNVAIGTYALATVATANGDTAIGFAALQNMTVGTGTAVGMDAGEYISSGTGNTAIGTETLSGNGTGSTPVTGNDNTAVGYEAMGVAVGTIAYNTAVGMTSLAAITNGNSNTAVGAGAINYSTIGASNTGVGAWALQGVSAAPLTGSNNVAVGQSAATIIQGAAANNTALGTSALYALTTGSGNTAVGQSAMNGNSGAPLTSATGNNTGVGYDALEAIRGTVANNTTIGWQAGYQITTGTGNIIVGESGNITTGSNNILIGNNLANTGVSTSSQLDIGDLIMGTFASSKVAIGTTTYQGTGLSVSGNVWAGATELTSDERLKKNIRTLEGGLEGIEKLRGVTYDWRPVFERTVGKDMSLDVGQRQMGVIAQEVAAVFPEAVTTGATGVESVNYDSLIAPLIEAIKAQQKQIAALTRAVKRQQSEIDPLAESLQKRNELDDLKQQLAHSAP